MVVVLLLLCASTHMRRASSSCTELYLRYWASSSVYWIDVHDPLEVWWLLHWQLLLMLNAILVLDFKLLMIGRSSDWVAFLVCCSWLMDVRLERLVVSLAKCHPAWGLAQMTCLFTLLLSHRRIVVLMIVFSFLSRPKDLVRAINHVLRIVSNLLLFRLLKFWRLCTFTCRWNWHIMLPKTTRFLVDLVLSRLSLSLSVLLFSLLGYGWGIILINSDNTGVHLHDLVLFWLLDVLGRSLSFYCLQ